MKPIRFTLINTKDKNQYLNMHGFKHSAMMDLPDWSGLLRNYYMRLRLERRNPTRRRYWYRAIKKEKFRLLEFGIDWILIDGVCKYLVSLKQVNADRLHLIMVSESEPFISVNFYKWFLYNILFYCVLLFTI